MGELFFKIFKFLDENRLVSTLLFVLLIGATGYQASKLSFTEETSDIMPGIDELKVADEVLHSSGISDRIILMITGNEGENATPEDLIAAAETLEKRLGEAFGDRLSSIESGMEEHEMLAVYREVIDNLPVLLDSSDLAHFAMSLQPSTIDSTIHAGYKRVISPAGMMWREAFLNDPLNMAAPILGHLNKIRENSDFELYGNHFMDTSRETVFMFLNSKYPSSETALNGKLMKDLQRLFAELEAADEDLFTIRIYGAVPVASGNASQIRRDINTTVTIAMILLSLFFGFYFRDIKAFLIVFIPALIGALLSIAVISTFYDHVAVISLGIGAVLLGITVDYSLHILIHLKRHGSSRDMYWSLTQPVLMSSLTTAAAFLCLLMIETKAIRDLGVFAALSVVAAAFFALILLPVLYRYRQTSNPEVSSGEPQALASGSGSIALAIWLVAIFTLTVFLALFIPKATFNADMDRINYMSPEMRDAEKIVNQATALNGAVIYGITIANDLGELKSRNGELVRTLEALSANGEIQSFQTVQQFILSEQEKLKRLSAWDQFWDEERLESLKASLQTTSEVLGIKQAAFNGFIDRLERNSKDPYDYQMPVLSESIIGEFLLESENFKSTVNIVTLDAENVDSVLTGLSKLEGVSPINLRNNATSYVKYLKADMRKLAWITFLVVFGILLLIFGRIEIAGLVILPIAISWIWTIGLTGLLGVDLNIVNIIITTFVFGLGVDYSIFLAKGALMRYAHGQDVLSDYKRGILLSCLTTVVGLGVLIFAKHPALKSISLISIIGILSAVIVTMSLVPVLFNGLLLHRPMSGKRPYTLWIFLLTAFAYFYFVFGCLLLTIIILILKLLPIPKKSKKSTYHWIMYCFVYSLVYTMANIKKDVIYSSPLSRRPVMYIANHQSFLDILLSIIIHPKIIILTNNWVWNSPFFGRVVRYADFYPVANGVEQSVEHLRALVQDGYSILIFPEGTRSPDGRIGRFKKGAFYLAEQLHLDIIPILLHGTGHCIQKNDLLIAGGRMTMKFLQPITITDESWGIGYRARWKSISSFFKAEYLALKTEVETPEYFKEILMSNYLYKGLVLPYYIRVKLKLAGNFNDLHKIIPRDARVTDLGCGYGYLALLLQLLAGDRKITGIDHDQNKIDIAANCYTGKGSVQFQCADIREVAVPESDVIILYDVLHYVAKADQLQMLRNSCDSLNPGGIIIVRDGEPGEVKKHRRTRLSEWFSTKLGFNKLSDAELCFLSFDEIREFADELDLDFEVMGSSRKTSNKLVVLSKPNV